MSYQLIYLACALGLLGSIGVLLYGMVAANSSNALLVVAITLFVASFAGFGITVTHQRNEADDDVRECVESGGYPDRTGGDRLDVKCYHQETP